MISIQENTKQIKDITCVKNFDITKKTIFTQYIIELHKFNQNIENGIYPNE